MSEPTSAELSRVRERCKALVMYFLTGNEPLLNVRSLQERKSIISSSLVRLCRKEATPWFDFLPPDIDLLTAEQCDLIDQACCMGDKLAWRNFCIAHGEQDIFAA